RGAARGPLVLHVPHAVVHDRRLPRPHPGAPVAARRGHLRLLLSAARRGPDRARELALAAGRAAAAPVRRRRARGAHAHGGGALPEDGARRPPRTRPPPPALPR